MRLMYGCDLHKGEYGSWNPLLSVLQRKRTYFKANDPTLFSVFSETITGLLGLNNDFLISYKH